MAFQSSLSSNLLMSSLLGDTFFWLQSYLDCFWYHISFHSIFAFLFHPLCLYAPKNCSCLFLLVLCRDLLYPAISVTSWFDFFLVHDILIILLMYHISAASSLLSRSFVSVQHSHPCRKMDHIFLFEMDFILVNVSVDKAILFLISVWHLASGVIVKPKYLKMPTCFILSPLQRILHTEMSDFAFS